MKTRDIRLWQAASYLAKYLETLAIEKGVPAHKARLLYPAEEMKKKIRGIGQREMKKL